MLNLLQLDEQQRQAVTFGDGPLLVLAGPGSGKTTVVTNRIFYLLHQTKIPPEKIVVLTFTKEAALSLQNRFLLQADKAYPVIFGTFHSFFYQILKRTNHNLPMVMWEAEQKARTLQEIAKSYGLSLNKEEIQEYLSAFGYYKNTLQLTKAKERLSVKCISMFEVLFRTYEAHRQKQNVMDYDDILYDCAKLLKDNPDTRKYWQKQFAKILVDEFQDINPMQYLVLSYLTLPKRQVFAVGDDDQSIYGFRGALPENLKRFQKEFQAATVQLKNNYRCSKEIVKASLLVIEENKKRFHKVFHFSDFMERGQVYIKGFADKEEQYAYLLKELLSLEKEKQVAVLFRTNIKLQYFAAYLTKNGIPFVAKGVRESIYEHVAVLDVLAYIRLAKETADRGLFFRIMNKPFRGINREKLLQQEQVDGDKKAKALMEKIARMKHMSLSLCVSYIRKVLGYNQYLQEKAKSLEEYQEWMELLDEITEEWKFYDTLQQFDEVQNKNREGMCGKVDREDIHIHLMTVHASKGLEFDHVRIMDCNDGMFPYGRLLDDENIEEERRIFYVAMTRAKISLGISYLLGSKKHPRIISRFLNPLLTDYSLLSTISSD